MRLGFTALAVVAAAVLCGGAIGAGGLPRAEALTQQPAAEYTGDVVVKFKPAATLADVGEALDDADAAPIASTAGSGLVLLEPDAGQSVDGAVADLEANPDVLFAEPDVVMRTTLTPTDPYYTSYQWHLSQIGLPAAWDTTTGSASVIVAVLDTGVQSTHPDLSGKITTGASAGYNFVSNNTNTTDDHSHGTFVAGIIAANTNNGAGGAGVCWSCKIMPVKVLDNTGSGSSFNVAQGIDWAVSHGADVVNMSLGGGAASALQTAVNNAWTAGVVVVAATGNDHGPVLYPAAYSNAIAVGSNEQNGARSSFSNYGPEIDIMAPGGSVLGTLCSCNGNPGGYGIGSGTSFAAPHVAGVAGLLIASGITDKNEIRTRLLSTATNMEAAGFDNNTGWGRVNAAAAIQGVDTTPPTVGIDSLSNGAVVSGMVDIIASASDNIGIEKVQFVAGGAYLGFELNDPYTKTWDSASVPDGTYAVGVRAVDLAGNMSGWVGATVTVANAPDATPPTVSITSLTNGAIVSGTVNIIASASDNVAVEKVQFIAGSAYLGYEVTSPFTKPWDTTTVPDGTYAIGVRAVDMSGNMSGWMGIWVTVMNAPDTTPPTAAITSLSNGQTVSGTITITASASDDVGVEKVQFIAAGTYLGYVLSPPYSRTWDTTTVANGTYAIGVRAVDAAGNTSGWIGIWVTVNN
jgi:subtilisin family serine protease